MHRSHSTTKQPDRPTARLLLCVLFDDMGKKGRVTKPKKSASLGHATDASKLVEQAQLALEKAQPELALKFYERAHAINALDTSVMDAMADVLLQLDDPDRAFLLLTRSIELEPQANPCKYLYLAQLQTNHEALASYRTGITLLVSEKEKTEPEVVVRQFNLLTLSIEVELPESSPLQSLQRDRGVVLDRPLVRHDLLRALTPLSSFEENAEAECEAAVSQSLSLDPSIDTKHLFASLRISQNRMSEACDVLEEIYQRIKQNREMLAQRTVIDELTGLPTPDPEDDGSVCV